MFVGEDLKSQDQAIFFAARALNRLCEWLSQEVESTIYTVSRSKPAKSIANSNVFHISKEGLVKTHGAKEFAEVMKTVIERESLRPHHTVTMYFTLAQHAGRNAARNNVMFARNFAQALYHVFSQDGAPRFRVVITGTDATRPSTSANYDEWVVDTQDQEHPVNVFGYKIWQRNFVYATSKLAQYYIIAESISALTNTDLSISLQRRIEAMEEEINEANTNEYRGADSKISMRGLNRLSDKWDAIEQELQPYLRVAKRISVCFTPLHGIPWRNLSFDKAKTEAKFHGSPKAFFIEQVLSRMQNAISIESAARTHFCDQAFDQHVKQQSMVNTDTDIDNAFLFG